MLSNARCYLDWLRASGAALPLPDEAGFFRIGHARFLFPVLRVHYQGSDGQPPQWRPGTWRKVARGYVRYLRADQVLEWIRSSCAEVDFPSQARWLLEKRFLFGVDEPSHLHRDLLAGRVESLRVTSNKSRLRWFRDEHVPTCVRDWESGLDPVHTCESARAGFSRYMAVGYEVDDLGQLTPTSGPTTWGAANLRNAHRLCTAPRRLMLGALIPAKAVPVGGDLSTLAGPVEGPGPGAQFGETVTVALSTLEGLTHEDAIVVSVSAAARLTRNEVLEKRVRVPALAGRVEFARPQGLLPGSPLARAWIDGYALGLRQGDPAIDADGWREIFLGGAELPADGVLIDVRFETDDDIRWRGTAIAQVHLRRPLRVGDKLATCHGIKGVLSGIWPDERMPVVSGRPADLVLGPMGIEKRRALGQLREMGLEKPVASGVQGGPALVLRMPNDACETARSIGDAAPGQAGFRFGEMELWALMAHGAPEIAAELVGAERSTARWMRLEFKCGAPDAKTAATRALNRFLCLAGIEREGAGTLWPRLAGCSLAFDANPPSAIEVRPDRLTLDTLSDSDAFLPAGLLSVPLESAIAFELGATQRRPGIKLRVERIHVLPPWLRPDVEGGPHPLTRAYWGVVRALNGGSTLNAALRRLLELALGPKGVGEFLTRHVLGRRLTRSARAVIVPDPSLKIDEVGVPGTFLAHMFEGVAVNQPRLVLVNRQPTLHRYNLLAMKAVATHEENVIRLPLGVLAAMGADFDGDHVTIVALTSASALAEAERLLPSAAGMRCDPFRPSAPAVFRFSRELASGASEDQLAEAHELSADEWAKRHARLQELRIRAEGARGLPELASVLEGGSLAGSTDSEWLRRLWQGMPEADWLSFADDEMGKVFNSERRKGKFGGVLRRQLYRLPWMGDFDKFAQSVRALHAMTERLTQSALSVKSGAGARDVNVDALFDDPETRSEELRLLDGSFAPDAVFSNLGALSEPTGLLSWFARPSLPRLRELLRAGLTGEADPRGGSRDPRLGWFLE